MFYELWMYYWWGIFSLPVSQIHTRESILFSIDTKGSTKHEQYTGFSDFRSYGAELRYDHDFVDVTAPNGKDADNNCSVQLNSRWFHDPSYKPVAYYERDPFHADEYVDEIEAFGFEK